MAVTTKTFLELKALLWQALGDYISVSTTTNITTNTSIISTTLNSYDDGRDDYFNDWYVYIDGTTNSGVARKISDYATTGGIITVFGANLVAETAARTIYVTRYDPTHIARAIQRACEELYPTLYVPLENQTLITGNILPDAFDDWSSTTALTWWSALSGVLAQTSTGGLFRYGKYSAKYTAGAANDYIYIDSDSYPRLLDFQGQTVNAYVMAYPEVADDPSIVIYTVKNDGTTTQTLTSSTTAAAGVYTLLKLENQTINDDLDYIAIRFKVATNAKYVYFDSPFLGNTANEYLLPPDFRDGHLSEVRVQDYGHANPPCFDLHPFTTKSPGGIITHSLIDIGNWRYITLDDPVPEKRRLRLLGRKPLETLSSDTDTLTLDAYRVPLLIEYAKMVFYEREGKPVSAEDVFKFKNEGSSAMGKYFMLKSRLGMTRPPENLRRRNI